VFDLPWRLSRYSLECFLCYPSWYCATPQAKSSPWLQWTLEIRRLVSAVPSTALACTDQTAEHMLVIVPKYCADTGLNLLPQGLVLVRSNSNLSWLLPDFLRVYSVARFDRPWILWGHTFRGYLDAPGRGCSWSRNESYSRVVAWLDVIHRTYKMRVINKGVR